MNKLMRNLQFKMLKQSLLDAKDYGPNLSLETLPDSAPPVDLNDPLVSSFLRCIRDFQKSPMQDLSGLRALIVGLIQSPATHDESKAMNGLGVLFDRIGVNGACVQLDRLFLHMTGSSLSEILDVSSVLEHPDDQGLDGNHGFSLMLGVARPGKAGTLLRASAVASSLDFLLPLIKPAITEQADRYEAFASDNESSDMELGRKDYCRLKPFCLMISKDDGYLTHLLVTKKPGNGYDIDWASVLLSGLTRETVLSLAAIAPEAISKKMKGRHLEDELGL